MTEPCRVFVSEDNTAVITCANCATSRTINVSKFKSREMPMRVRCGCRSTFEVSFEFRKNFRKRTELAGYCCRVPKYGHWVEMVVKNVSLGGIMLLLHGIHNVREGNEMTVKFWLDDKRRSKIKRTAIVKRVTQGNWLHCQFSDRVEYPTSLAFYFMG